MRPLVKLSITILDRGTMGVLVPTFEYSVEVHTYLTEDEHPELLRINAEARARMIYASRLVNKYMKEDAALGAALEGKNWLLHMQPVNVSYP